MFSTQGYDVEVATDGLSALTLFHEVHPSIVLLEAMIPKKHGFEVCQELKKTPIGSKTPIVIMTAVYKGRKYRSQAMHVHGCDEYVEKPCPPEEILEIVKRFVPPGAIAKAIAVGRNERAASPAPAERLGEVIPFPSRGSRAIRTDFEDEAEAEIMSKLDEILPDTPIFNEKGLGASRGASSLAGELAAEIEIEEGMSILDDGIGAGAGGEDESPPARTTPEPSRPSRAKGMELSLELPDDMRTGATRTRRRMARPVLDSEKTSFPISKPYLVFGGIVLFLIVVIIYLNRFY